VHRFLHCLAVYARFIYIEITLAPAKQSFLYWRFTAVLFLFAVADDIITSMNSIFKQFTTEKLTFVSRLNEDDLLENINEYCANNSFYSFIGGYMRGRIKANGRFKFIRLNASTRVFASRPAVLTGETAAIANGCLVELKVRPGLSYKLNIIGCFILGSVITMSQINESWLYIGLGLMLMIGVPVFNIALNMSAKDNLIDEFIEEFDLYDVEE